MRFIHPRMPTATPSVGGLVRALLRSPFRVERIYISIYRTVSLHGVAVCFFGFGYRTRYLNFCGYYEHFVFQRLRTMIPIHSHRWCMCFHAKPLNRSRTHSEKRSPTVPKFWLLTTFWTSFQRRSARDSTASSVLSIQSTSMVLVVSSLYIFTRGTRYEPWMVHLYNTSENSAPFHCRYSTQKESLSACSSCESFVGPAWTGASTIWASVRSHVSVYLRLNNCLNYQINSLKVIIYSSQYKLAKILDVSGSEERNCEISTDSNYSVFTVHSHHCHPNVLHTLQKYVGASFRPYQRSSVPFSIRKALLSPASGDRYKLSWIHTHIHTRNQNSLDAKQSKMTFT